MLSRRRGTLFVVSAPSGTGKTTLCSMLMKSVCGIQYSISYTTRKPRKGEINGKDYFFVSEEEFRKMIERGEFLEWAEVHGHLYGTSRSQIEKAIHEGKDVLLDIDTQGAINIKNQIKDAVLIFILPPSWEELEKRLKLRGTENQEEIKKRLKTAREEVKKINFYDYVIVNDEIQKAFEQLKSIIIAERCRTSRFELLKFKQKVDSM